MSGQEWTGGYVLTVAALCYLLGILTVLAVIA